MTMTAAERITQRAEWENYHVQVFTEYYNSMVTDMPMEEVAEDMWNELESLESPDTLNPFELINYSAGVYAGLHDSGDADAIAVLPDLSNLEFVTDSTDLWEVWRRMDSPDAHADGACDKLEDFAEAIKAHREDDCLPTIEELTPALLAFMQVACPEYTVVLRAWNLGHDADTFWQAWADSHVATFESYYDM